MAAKPDFDVAAKVNELLAAAHELHRISEELEAAGVDVGWGGHKSKSDPLGQKMSVTCSFMLDIPKKY